MRALPGLSLLSLRIVQDHQLIEIMLQLALSALTVMFGDSGGAEDLPGSAEKGEDIARMGAEFDVDV